MHTPAVRFALTAECAICTLADVDSTAIIALRKERLKWSQERLAEYLGVDRATVSRMETGQPPSGPVEKLLKQLDQETPPTHANGEAA